MFQLRCSVLPFYLQYMCNDNGKVKGVDSPSIMDSESGVMVQAVAYFM